MHIRILREIRKEGRLPMKTQRYIKSPKKLPNSTGKKGFENNPQNINLEGRPTEYDPGYIEKVDEYLKKCRDRRRLFHKVRGEKSDSYEEIIKVKLPSIEDFADYLGVARKSLYNWREEHEDFAFALEKIDNEQRRRLINEGLAGAYSPVIAKLMLSANHGMREGIDATSGGEPLNKFDDETIDRIAERIARGKGSDGDTSGKEKSH